MVWLVNVSDCFVCLKINRVILLQIAIVWSTFEISASAHELSSPTEVFGFIVIDSFALNHQFLKF